MVLLFYFFYFLTLQYCIGFAIYQHQYIIVVLFFFSVTLIKIFILCILHIIAKIELNFLIKMMAIWFFYCEETIVMYIYNKCSIDHLDVFFYENIKGKT